MGRTGRTAVLLMAGLCCLGVAAASSRPAFYIEDDKLILEGKPMQIISGR